MKLVLKILAWVVGLVVAFAIVAVLAARRPDIPYERLEAVFADDASQYALLPTPAQAQAPGEVRVHFRDEGPREAPVVLMVHGFSASLHTWQPWAERLTDSYRVVRLDLPGHGLTRAPDGYQANIEGYRDLVLAFADAKGLDRFTLVGSSMGGNVAWQTALAAPDRLDGLVLVAASGWPDERLDDTDEPLVFKLIRNPLIGPIIRDLDNRALIEDGLKNSVADPALVDTAMVDRYAMMARAPGHREILFQIAAGFGTRDMADEGRIEDILTPSLVMHGELDNLVPFSHGQRFAETLPNVQTAFYSDIGHIPQEEIPDVSVADLRAFLEGVYPPAIEAEIVGGAEPAETSPAP